MPLPAWCVWQVVPGPGNVVFLPVADQQRSVLDARAKGLASVLVEVDQRDAARHMDAVARVPVVFLGHPVKVCARMTGWFAAGARQQGSAVREARV